MRNGRHWSYFVDCGLVRCSIIGVRGPLSRRTDGYVDLDMHWRTVVVHRQLLHMASMPRQHLNRLASTHFISGRCPFGFVKGE